MCVDAVGSDSNAIAQLERGIRVKDRRSVANRDRLRSVAKNQVVWSSGDAHVPCALVVFSLDIITDIEHLLLMNYNMVAKFILGQCFYP